MIRVVNIKKRTPKKILKIKSIFIGKNQNNREEISQRKPRTVPIIKSTRL